MRRYYLLVVLFLIIFGTRLTLSSQDPHLYGDSSYHHLRQVEHIRETGLPLRHDPLSFGGRPLLLSPLFDYLLAVFSLFLPMTVALKVAPNLFASSFVIIAYFIAWRLTRSSHCSHLTAALAGFIPVYFVETFNSVHIYSLVVPLIGLLVYTYLHIDKHATGYLITLVTLSFLHPSVLLFIVGLLLYALIAILEGMRLTEREREIILFSVLFVLWSQFVLYKPVFAQHGFHAIWQNIPQALRSMYFQDFSLLEAIYRIDAVPFLFGLYAIRQYLFKISDKAMHFLIGLALATGLVLWLKLIPLTEGLILLGTFLVLLFAKSYQYRIKLVQQSRASRYLWVWKTMCFAFFLTTAAGASLHLAIAKTNDSTTVPTHEALAWLREASGHDVVASAITDSQQIMAIAERPTMIDDHFLLVEHSDLIYDDMVTIFTSPHITQVAERLDEYGIRYIYLSPAAREQFSTQRLPSADARCLPLVYNHTIQIYEWRCQLEVL